MVDEVIRGNSEKGYCYGQTQGDNKALQKNYLQRQFCKRVPPTIIFLSILQGTWQETK